MIVRDLLGGAIGPGVSALMSRFGPLMYQNAAPSLSCFEPSISDATKAVGTPDDLEPRREAPRATRFNCPPMLIIVIARRLIRLNGGTRSKAFGACVVAAALISAGGCSPDRHGDRSHEARGGAVTPKEAARLAHAEELLISSCMRRQGIPYVPARSLTSRAAQAPPYVIDDPAWARREGFGFDRAATVKRAKQRDPNERYLRRLSTVRRARVLAAFMGARPTGMSVTAPTGHRVQASDQGCIAEAQAKLYGELRRWFEADVIASNLQPLYMARVIEDLRFRRAQRDWARCMHHRGLRVQSPEALRAIASRRAGRLGRADARRLEVRLALAEARCARRTRFGAVARELTRHYRSIVHRRYRREVNTRRQLQLAALPRAETIIRGSSGAPGNPQRDNDSKREEPL